MSPSTLVRVSVCLSSVSIILATEASAQTCVQGRYEPLPFFASLDFNIGIVTIYGDDAARSDSDLRDAVAGGSQTWNEKCRKTLNKAEDSRVQSELD